MKVEQNTLCSKVKLVAESGIDFDMKALLLALSKRNQSISF